MNFAIFLCLFSFVFEFWIVSASPCDPNWEPYKDEKCFQVLDQAPFQNYLEAVKTCAAEDGGQLVRVDSQEEEDFLVRYLFTQKKVVDNLWLGAKYSGAAFHWEATGQANLTYSNWASGSPKNREGYCVMMNAHEERRGKWSDEPCQGKNLVLCQKEQNLSLAVMKSILFEMRKNLLTSEKQFKEEVTHLKANLLTSERQQKQFKEELTHLKANLVPLGFIYTQYPKDKTPAELWPWMTWTEVSSTYANVFFRVAGSQTAAFGTIQQENVPVIDSAQAQGCNWENEPNGGCHDLANGAIKFRPQSSVSIPKTSQWSDYLYTGISTTGEGRYLSMYRFHSTGGEVRPQNMAIKIWKRTA